VNGGNREWNYHNNYYRVKSFDCPMCGINFRGYFHNNELIFTIPKSPNLRLKIVKYLHVQKEATKEQIARVFRLSAKEVEDTLLELEKEKCVISFIKG